MKTAKGEIDCLSSTQHYARIDFSNTWHSLPSRKNYKTRAAARRAAEKLAKDFGFKIEWEK